MLPPIKLPVPEGCVGIYLTAISLYHKESNVSVSWTFSTANFGADFVGPSDSHVLADKIFHDPIVFIEGDLPSELLVSMNFHDTMTTQHSITGPITKTVGVEGINTQVQISGFAAADKHRKQPMTLTVLFRGKMSLRPTDS